MEIASDQKITLEHPIIGAMAQDDELVNWESYLTSEVEVIDPVYRPVIGFGVGVLSFYGDVNNSHGNLLMGTPGYKINVMVPIGRTQDFKVNFFGLLGNLQGFDRQMSYQLQHDNPGFIGNTSFNTTFTQFGINMDTFPAGTLTGAPKIKAMELIEKYEGSSRGFYGGSIGYFGLDGSVNQAITIRSFLSRFNNLFYRAGAGVVADSDEQSELKEVENKLMALRQAMPRTPTTSLVRPLDHIPTPTLCSSCSRLSPKK